MIHVFDSVDADEATAHRELALRVQANYRVNEVRLERLFWLFRRACIAVAFEVVLWLVVVAL